MWARRTRRIGSEQRIIFAGIRQSYRPEDLIGKQAIVVAHLQTRKMRFVSTRACCSLPGLTVLMWWWRNLASHVKQVSTCAPPDTKIAGSLRT
jgi:hypothetical protein